MDNLKDHTNHSTTESSSSSNEIVKITIEDDAVIRRAKIQRKYVSSFLRGSSQFNPVPLELENLILDFTFKSPFRPQKIEYSLRKGHLTFKRKLSCFINYFETKEKQIRLQPSSQLLLGFNYPFVTEIKIKDQWIFDFNEYSNDIAKNMSQFLHFMKSSTHKKLAYLLPLQYSKDEIICIENNDHRSSPQMLAVLLTKYIQRSYIKIDLIDHASKKKETLIVMEGSCMQNLPFQIIFLQPNQWKLQTNDYVWERKSSYPRTKTVRRQQYSNSFQLLEGDRNDEITRIEDIPDLLDHSYFTLDS